MKQTHIFVSGIVQGVWYRQFVKTNAIKLGLTGWVRNLPDDRVEAVIQGPKNKIEELIEFCREGPPLADVKDIQIGWDDGDKKFEDFIVF